MSQQIRADVEAVLHRRVKSIEPIPEGHSGFTYFVDGDYVLRLPPPGARIASPADVVRQGRIMSALRSVGLPTPAIPLMSSDAAIDGRPFILMERVDGVRIEETAMRENPLDIATSAVNVLKRMQALPIEKTGIGDEEPVGLREEMMRWAMLMQRAPEELTTRAGELGGLLAARIPTERAPTLVHGDYHYGNMLFRGPQVVAVLDWEIAELGQPLLDLACQCVVAATSKLGAEGVSVPGGGAVDVPVEWLLEQYGAPPEEFDWYLA